MPALPTAPVTVIFINTTGQTINAFPANSSLATWATNKVLFAESAAPNLGKYTGTIPITLGGEWYFFASATQPADWSGQIGSIDINVDPTATEVATKVLQLDWTTLTPVIGQRDALSALALLRNKVTRTATSNANGLTVYSTDDATILFQTTTIVPTSTTHPITSSDPV